MPVSDRGGLSVNGEVGTFLSERVARAEGLFVCLSVTHAIEIEGLTKTFQRGRHRRSVAVAGLDLCVPAGGVYGFLGPNGAGKTTTIRCLLGLVRPTSGWMRMLGEDVPERLPATIRRVGAIVETPALFPTMTGRENLHLLGAIDGISRRRSDELLEQVGLTAAAGQTVRKYSLGMRQRLGLAAALLKDPALLILDEPANGLDPSGMREIRTLLRALGAEGRTVFVSSHMLSEVEQMLRFGGHLECRPMHRRRRRRRRARTGRSGTHRAGGRPRQEAPPRSRRRGSPPNTPTGICASRCRWINPRW